VNINLKNTCIMIRNLLFSFVWSILFFTCNPPKNTTTVPQNIPIAEFPLPQKDTLAALPIPENPPTPISTPASTPPTPMPITPPPRQESKALQVGAEQTAQLLPLLSHKKVALVVNQTSLVEKKHLVDALLAESIDIVKVFAPEHGFRGIAANGEKIANTVDEKTGLPIISLYGKTRKPTAEMLQDIDVLVFDIQDVGARFYTYISTLYYIMEAAASYNKEVVVLDRPNPNGHYIDGCMLNPLYKSFVGMINVPIVHGMTVGEIAKMLNGEHKIGDRTCKLSVIPCKNYSHKTPYSLSIKPSPNLPNDLAVYLYPSLCLFEGTIVSVGRGTDKQFQIIGAPEYNKSLYSFTPTPKEGAMSPPYNGQTCFGYDLSALSAKDIRNQKGIELKWLIQMYNECPDKKKFFSNANFFDQLAGNSSLREQIIAGKSIATIKASWQEDLKAFQQVRKKYLLYPDFE